MGTPQVGDPVLVVDETGHPHIGLVTVYFGGLADDGPLNVVFTSGDSSKTDPYGRQLERLSSLSHKSKTTAPGRYWDHM